MSDSTRSQTENKAPLRWDDGQLIHACEGARMDDRNPDTYLIWTVCKRDVPANRAFRSWEAVTCPNCVVPEAA